MEFIKNYSTINICDIGSSSCEPTEFIEKLLENTKSKIVGFEPNIDEYKKLKKIPNRIYHNYAIGDGKVHDLNITAEPGMSSFLEPNLEYLKLFHMFEDWSKIVKKFPTKTKKLDDLNENFDFIKIDVQGYESEIINFGKNKIKDCLVVQIETSPVPLYHKEKKFSFILDQLEKLDFNLHMFNKIDSRMFKPMTFKKGVYSGLHHLFQLECVFIKNFENINKMNEEDLKKIILIMFWSFKSYDLVDFLISKLDSITGEKNLSSYRKLMSSIQIVKNY